MNGLGFAQPAWFWGALLLVPLVVLRLRAHLKASRQLPGLVSPRLAGRLVSGNNEARRWTAFVLRSLALLCLIAALARPQWGFEEIESESEARNLLIAIDTSRSMLADDVPPSRLARAKLAAADIVLSLPEDRIGVLAFAGTAFLQAPLTVDHEAVLETIDQLDTDTIPRGGTNLSAAVTLSLESIREAKAGASALVLFSDGEAHEGLDRIEAVREEAGKNGLVILAVGVGTPGGSIIPETDENGRPVPGVFVKDENGQVVRTRLVGEGLQALAAKGGAYVHLGGAAPLTRVVEQIRQSLASSRERSEALRRPIERFLWPLAAAALLMTLSHVVPLLWLKPLASPGRSRARRRAAAAGLGLILASPTLDAADPLTLGHKAFAREDFAGALAAYESSLGEKLGPRARRRLQMGIGAAAYRLGDYERAAEAFGAAVVENDPQARGEALYNLGNTLYRRGESALQPPSAPDPDQPRPPGPAPGPDLALREWEGAIEHFESSLALDPGNPRTLHNLEFVKARLEELRQRQREAEQKEEQQPQDSPQKPQDDSKKPQDDSKKSEDENQDGKSPDSPSDQDGSEKPDQPKDSDHPPEQPSEPPSDPSEDPGDSPKPRDSGSSGQPGQPDPGQAPPPQPDAPADGKLQANPNQNRPEPAGEPTTAQAQAADRLANPETGYAPTEARQLLEALADETEVRPIPPAPASRSERFKNW